MPPLPTDGAAAAGFILRHLYRPVLLDGRPLFAVAETERPLDGDVWFWTDDNAKVLEFLSRPELWRLFPDQVGAILGFVRAMCRGPFVFRRLALPRLEPGEGRDGAAIWHHALLDLRCDAGRGEVTAGIRLHDERASDFAAFAGNHVEFAWRGRRFRVAVAPPFDAVDAVRQGDRLVLRHAGELRFRAGRQERRLGRIEYRYAVEAGAAAIEVEAVLDLAPGLRVEEVVLTVAHDRLAANRFAEIDAVPGYYAIREARISGDARAIHALPREPGRLAGFETRPGRRGRLERVVARYAFPGPQSGSRLAVGERKWLTAGGPYQRVADYRDLLGRQSPPAPGEAVLDLSIAYDYGAPLNAFAKCFAVLAGGGIGAAPAGLAEELRALFDRHLDWYFALYIDEHERRPNAVFSRELAFAILGVATAWRATGAPGYRRRLARLCEVLLDFEMPIGRLDGRAASVFLMRSESPEASPADCQSAALLALAAAAPLLGDGRLAAAIDRGLGAYRLASFAGYLGRYDFEAVATAMVPNYRLVPGGRALRRLRRGGGGADPAIWSYKAGLALRLFRALRQASDPALRAVAARHRDRIDRFDAFLRAQLAALIVEREGGIEFRCSGASAETNSETQPWVMLGLIGHPCD